MFFWPSSALTIPAAVHVDKNLACLSSLISERYVQQTTSEIHVVTCEIRVVTCEIHVTTCVINAIA